MFWFFFIYRFLSPDEAVEAFGASIGVLLHQHPPLHPSFANPPAYQPRRRANVSLLARSTSDKKLFDLAPLLWKRLLFNLFATFVLFLDLTYNVHSPLLPVPSIPYSGEYKIPGSQRLNRLQNPNHLNGSTSSDIRKQTRHQSGGYPAINIHGAHPPDYNGAQAL